MRATGASGVELHYDAQACRHSNLSQALATRRSGILFTYKRYANSIKRQLIATYASNAGCLVDVGCGRGGDISKWRDARVRHVVAMDLSAAQLEEARGREQDGKGGGGQRGGGRGGGTQIVWRQHSMLEPSLAALLATDLQWAGADGGADAVAAMFCIQFAFGSEATASALLAQVSAMLRPGGVFFGTAPDAATILETLGGGQAVALEPPEVPFVLRLKRLELGGSVAAGISAEGDGVSDGAGVSGGGGGGGGEGGGGEGGGRVGGGGDGGGGDGGGVEGGGGEGAGGAGGRLGLRTAAEGGTGGGGDGEGVLGGAKGGGGAGGGDGGQGNGCGGEGSGGGEGGGEGGGGDGDGGNGGGGEGGGEAGGGEGGGGEGGAALAAAALATASLSSAATIGPAGGGDGGGGEGGGGDGGGRGGGGGEGERSGDVGSGGGGGEFGHGLFFSLQDTVTQDSDGLDDAHEYLVWRETLTRLAAPHGLRPVAGAVESMLRAECVASSGGSSAVGRGGQAGRDGVGGLPVLSEAEARVARLYFCFAFRKDEAPQPEGGPGNVSAHHQTPVYTHLCMCLLCYIYIYIYIYVYI